VGSPLWRTSRIRAEEGIITVRASGFVKVSCKNSQGQIQKAITSLHLSFDLVYAAPIDLKSQWWSQPSKIDLLTMYVGLDDSLPELVNTNRTFIVKSVQYDKAELNAGDTVNVTVTLETFDVYKPTTCELYLTASHWAFHAYMSLPAVDVFKPCEISKLPSGLWQVRGKFTFPSTTQPDLFYIPLLRLMDGSTGPTASDRFALPIKPTVFTLKNANAKPPLKMTAWRALGLVPTPVVFGAPVKNSFKVVPDEAFWVEVDLQGSQTVGMEFIELDLITDIDNGQGEVVRPWSSRVDYLKPVVIANERIAIPGGTRLRYKMVLPSKMDAPTSGFRIRRFYVQSDDLAWAQWEMRSPLESYFVTERLVSRPNR
jgi:hypothetical protein